MTSKQKYSPASANLTYTPFSHNFVVISKTATQNKVKEIAPSLIGWKRSATPSLSATLQMFIQNGGHLATYDTVMKGGIIE